MAPRRAIWRIYSGPGSAFLGRHNARSQPPARFPVFKRSQEMKANGSQRSEAG